jgi:cytoskeletal protein CcmA (bactofilin family)
MKKRLLALLLAIVGLSGLLGFGVTRAADIRTADFTNIGRDEVIDSSLYVAGATITMQGTVKGDLFCAGQSVEIDGVVEGDVLCASQTLRINGTVIGDIRAAAQTAVVGAQVGRSASILGQTVTLSEDARVQADLTIFGNALHILGQVGRDMVGGSEVATIAGVIGRDIEMASNSVTLVDDARVNGNFIYTSNNDATVSQSAVVGGTTQRKDPQTQQNREQASPLGLLAGPLYWFAAMFLVVLRRCSCRHALSTKLLPYYLSIP